MILSLVVIEREVQVYRINASVGKSGRNLGRDVKIVQALINVYCRVSNRNRLEVSGSSSESLEQEIAQFQTAHLNLGSLADSRVDPNGRTLRALNQFLQERFRPVGISPPSKGLLTWNAEGNEGGPFHSRKLHVPSASSGLTIGRGYDCRRKPARQITSDLVGCGLTANDTAVLARASGLSGRGAEDFIIDNDLLDFQVTPEQQKAIFNISYQEEALEVQRICAKQDVVKLYGETDWDSLNAIIRDVIIDLKFRGDYTGASRRFLQKSIADNDLDAFSGYIKDATRWPGVPADRFQRRVSFVSCTAP